MKVSHGVACSGLSLLTEHCFLLIGLHFLLVERCFLLESK